MGVSGVCIHLPNIVLTLAGIARAAILRDMEVHVPRISLRKVETTGAVFGVLAGSLLHFTYELSGRSKIVGVFSAVNESPWEHLKLYVFPIAVYMVVEAAVGVRWRILLYAKLVQLVAGMLFIIAFFYTYTGALGIESVWVDVASFVVAMCLGYLLSYRLIARGGSGLPASASAIGVAVVVLLVVLTTFAPPHLPLFRDHNTGHYGIN